MSDAFEFARRSATAVTHRHEPASLTLTLADLLTADGHTISAKFTTSLRLIDRRADVQLFDEQLLGARQAVTLDDVRQFLLGPLKTSLETFAAQHDAATCLRQTTTIETLLLQRCNALGFACGLDFFPPVELQLASESLRASQLKDQLNRQQLEEIDRANRLSAKLKETGTADRLPVAEQMALLPLVMQRAMETAVNVCVAAGDRLICLDPNHLSMQVTPVPPEIGLLRCVRLLWIDGVLRTVVGGQRGLWLPAIESANAVTLKQAAASARGINSVAWLASTRQLIGAHGELGLIAWPIDRTDAPRIITAPPEPRWLTTIDERLVFASAGDLCVCDGQQTRVAIAGAARIATILLFEHDLWLVREDGTIDTIDRGALTNKGTRRVATAIQAASAITEAGLRVAAIAGVNGEVECVTATGDVLARFPKSLGAIRMLAVAGGHIVGVSSDRSTLLIWNAGRPQTEPRSLNILARFGHRIADIAANID